MQGGKSVAKKSMIANKSVNKNLKCVNIHVVNVVVVLIQYSENLNYAVFVSVNLHIKVKFLVLKKQAGNTHNREGGNNKWS